MKRIVIKIGSQIILDDEEKEGSDLNNILSEIVLLRSKGYLFTIVSSGAVALAKKNISLINSQEGTTSSKQALSSIGQVYLMNKYKSFFNPHNIECAQVLAGRDNFNSRLAYLNIRSALEELYSYNVIPIINENDVVSTMEIEGKFYGDNDRLAAIVSNAIDADQLILFGKTKGLYTSDPNKNTNSKIIKKVEKIDKEIISYASLPGDNIGSGGMKSKIEAAKICMESGINCSISSVDFDNTIFRIINSEDIGTKFIPNDQKKEAKKRWLVTGLSESKGTIVIDDGASNAMLNNGASLLSVGIKTLEGEFKRGDIVVIKNNDKYQIGFGISNYDSGDVIKLIGKDSKELKNILLVNHGDEIIHRNNFVFLENK
jgi:glutamate 5-kinase